MSQYASETESSTAASLQVNLEVGRMQSGVCGHVGTT